MKFVYPYDLEPDEGLACVSFPDVPEALTSADPSSEAFESTVHDCLIAALGFYIQERDPLPRPSAAKGRKVVTLDALESAKLALYSAMKAQRVTNVALAERLGVTENVIRRLLDLDHRSHIGQVESALKTLGQRLAISVKAA